MRLYTFVNFYLSSIQQGIQTAHVLQDLNNKYRKASLERKVLWEWADDHKTIITLNGGNRASIENVYFRITNLVRLRRLKLKLPFAFFHEDDDSLGGIITSCCVVVPESIYGMPPLGNVPLPVGTAYDDEWKLSELLKSFPLAR